MKKNTQTGFLKIIENLILIHPLFYLICRKFARYFNIYESDMHNLKNFIKKKINIIDIGASDGISAKYFIKNFKVNKIYCYEPNKIYSKNLENLKKKYSGKIILRKFKLIKKKINLIKIDTNGYEYEIIKSLQKQIVRDRPFIIIENNHQKYSIIKNLKKYDYLLKNMSQTNTLNLFFVP